MPLAVDGRVPEDEDAPLLDLLDTLVSDRGRVAAAEALGVNYRTVARCQQSRRVSRRMRQVLQEFRDSQGAGDDGGGIVTGDVAGEEIGDRPELRAAQLEQENRELRDKVEAQAEELEALRWRAGELGERGQAPGGADAVDGDQGRQGDWRPPRRGHGLPDAGVVTLEEQPDEAHAFGPAAPLVAEWREVRAKMGDGGSRVDRAAAAVRRWDLEVAMLREFHLTLAPETEPLDESRRRDHVRWRGEALAVARKELSRAKRTRLLRRLLTLGLWRK